MVILNPKDLKVVEQLSEGPIKNWYKKAINEGLWLRGIVEQYEQMGYKLDFNSGLMFKHPYSQETIENLGYTVLDIVFPRPVDEHLHKDVDEAFSVINGKGEFYLENALTPLEIGSEIYVPVNTPHRFKPYGNYALEIRIACSGILDSEKEEQITRFDKW